MRTVSALPICLVLAACDSSNDRDMAECHQEALRAAPGEYASERRDEYQKSCMAVKGYHFSALPFRCGHGDPYQDAECYMR
jgi:hypothetical protein